MPKGVNCPLCAEWMRPVTQGKVRGLGCPKCHGLWVAASPSSVVHDVQVPAQRVAGWQRCPDCEMHSLEPRPDAALQHWRCIRCDGRFVPRQEPQRIADGNGPPADSGWQWIEWLGEGVIEIVVPGS
jgi:Zn-finger nucleic acid-binding protein